MANGKTVKNFLVGLGFDYDEKGAKQIDSSIDSIKGKALQLGAVVAGAFGLKEMTIGFADANDALGKFASTMGLDADMVAAFGRALAHEGGTVEGFIGQIENLERLRAGVAVGDTGWMGPAGAAGIDVNAITEATDATEAYLNLAEQFATMTGQQRLNAAQALGFDNASIRLLSGGRENLEQLVEAERRMRPVTDEMTKAAARFNDETQDLMTNIGGVADKISMSLLPVINDVVSGMNDWIGANRELIGEGVDTIIDEAPKIAAGWALAGPVGGLAAGAAGAAWDWGPKDVEEVTGWRPPDWLFQPIGSLIADPVESVQRGGSPGGMPAAYGRPLKVEANLHLDGRVIDQKIIEVNNREYQDALDEIETNIEG